MLLQLLAQLRGGPRCGSTFLRPVESLLLCCFSSRKLHKYLAVALPALKPSTRRPTPAHCPYLVLVLPATPASRGGVPWQASLVVDRDMRGRGRQAAVVGLARDWSSSVARRQCPTSSTLGLWFGSGTVWAAEVFFRFLLLVSVFLSQFTVRLLVTVR